MDAATSVSNSGSDSAAVVNNASDSILLQLLAHVTEMKHELHSLKARLPAEPAVLSLDGVRRSPPTNLSVNLSPTDAPAALGSGRFRPPALNLAGIKDRENAQVAASGPASSSHVVATSDFLSVPGQAEPVNPSNLSPSDGSDHLQPPLSPRSPKSPISPLRKLRGKIKGVLAFSTLPLSPRSPASKPPASALQAINEGIEASHSDGASSTSDSSSSASERSRGPSPNVSPKAGAPALITPSRTSVEKKSDPVTANPASILTISIPGDSDASQIDVAPSDSQTGIRQRKRGSGKGASATAAKTADPELAITPVNPKAPLSSNGAAAVPAALSTYAKTASGPPDDQPSSSAAEPSAPMMKPNGLITRAESSKRFAVPIPMLALRHLSSPPTGIGMLSRSKCVVVYSERLSCNGCSF